MRLVNSVAHALHISTITVILNITILEAVSLLSLQFQVSHNTSAACILWLWSLTPPPKRPILCRVGR